MSDHDFMIWYSGFNFKLIIQFVEVHATLKIKTQPWLKSRHNCTKNKNNKTQID